MRGGQKEPSRVTKTAGGKGGEGKVQETVHCRPGQQKGKGDKKRLDRDVQNPVDANKKGKGKRMRLLDNQSLVVAVKKRNNSQCSVYPRGEKKRGCGFQCQFGFRLEGGGEKKKKRIREYKGKKKMKKGHHVA